MTTEVTIAAILLGGLGVCSTVIVHLWQRLTKVTTDMESKLVNCESQHVEANKQILNLSVEVAEIRGRDKGINELAKAIVENIKGT